MNSADEQWQPLPDSSYAPQETVLSGPIQSSRIKHSPIRSRLDNYID